MLEIGLFLLQLVVFVSGKHDKNLIVEKMCGKNACIPRIIWSHWAENDLPEDVQEMVDVTRKSLENFTYRLLSPSNLSGFLEVSVFPVAYKRLHLAGKADYIRVNLLNRYGGVYIDSTTYVNSGSATEWFFSKTINGRAQITTFEDGYSPGFFSPSFFGAVENSLFMRKFKIEFDLVLGMNQRHSYYLIFNIVEKMVVNNHSLRKVVQTLPNEQNSQRLIFECHFFRGCFRNRLLHDPVARTYPFIKLFHSFRNGKKFYIDEVGYSTGIYDSKKNFIWHKKVQSFGRFLSVKRKKKNRKQVKKRVEQTSLNKAKEEFLK